MGTAFRSPAWQRGGDGRRQAEAVQRLGRLLEQRVPVFGERGRASPLRAVGRRAGRGCHPLPPGMDGWVGGGGLSPDPCGQRGSGLGAVWCDPFPARLPLPQPGIPAVRSL